jgi:long-chain acyl-CoA synthetase
MTETAPIIAFTRPGDYIPGCSGKPLPSVEVKIDNEELCARGKNLMLGYYNRPQETADVIDSDGFLHTGDLAQIDEEGRVTITGRKKEIIVLSNGKNVQPNEIEFQLEKYDTYVKEVAVTEKNDALWAIIVPQRADATEDFLKENVIQPYNKTVENYKKIMNIFIYHGELPRTKLEKLQRFKLKDILDNKESVAPKKVEAPVFADNPELQAIATYIFVKSSIIMESYKKLLQEDDFSPKRKKTSPILGRISGIYWIVVTAIFLAICLPTHNWKQAGIIWPIAGVLFAAVYSIAKMCIKDED